MIFVVNPDGYKLPITLKGIQVNNNKFMRKNHVKNKVKTNFNRHSYRLRRLPFAQYWQRSGASYLTLVNEDYEKNGDTALFCGFRHCHGRNRGIRNRQ